VAAAVIEFNSLPDAVRTGAENDNFLLRGGCRLILFFIGRVEIRCVAFELGGAGIDALVDRLQAVLLAEVADFFLAAFAIQTPGSGEATVGESMRLASRSTSVGSDSMGCFSSSSCMSLISLSW